MIGRKTTPIDLSFHLNPPRTADGVFAPCKLNLFYPDISIKSAEMSDQCKIKKEGTLYVSSFFIVGN